jgi:hypothetical protein
MVDISGDEFKGKQIQMRKQLALLTALTAAGLLISSGIASAQTTTLAPRGSDTMAPPAAGQQGGMTNGAGPGGTTGMTGAPTNPNPQSGTGAGGVQSATPPATGSGNPASPTPGGTSR